MKPRVAVHKFSSCDGCQLAFLNLGETLLQVAELVDLVHFAEAGPVDAEAQIDLAFIEGSLNTAHDLQRIQQIRANSRFLISIGACATAGGIQALRNLASNEQGGTGWLADIYARPDYIDSLDQVTPIAAAVKVDLELWGCPVNSGQILGAIRALLFGVVPVMDQDKVCLECKRQQAVCVLVARGLPCMGPVTRTGCGALCPRFGRDCYACYGPTENSNTHSLANRLEGLGLLPAAVAQRFLHINSQAPAFLQAGQAAELRIKDISDDE